MTISEQLWHSLSVDWAIPITEEFVKRTPNDLYHDEQYCEAFRRRVKYLAQQLGQWQGRPVSTTVDALSGKNEM